MHSGTSQASAPAQIFLVKKCLKKSLSIVALFYDHIRMLFADWFHYHKANRRNNNCMWNESNDCSSGIFLLFRDADNLVVETQSGDVSAYIPTNSTKPS